MKRRRIFWGCDHSLTITTITAGLAREVCELCGNVAVSYVEPVVQIRPSTDDIDEDGMMESGDRRASTSYEAIIVFEETSRLLTCGLCSQAAVFMIPDGLRCDEHAWQAAAYLDWESEDPWVPISLDHRSPKTL